MVGADGKARAVAVRHAQADRYAPRYANAGALFVLLDSPLAALLYAPCGRLDADPKYRAAASYSPNHGLAGT